VEVLPYSSYKYIFSESCFHVPSIPSQPIKKISTQANKAENEEKNVLVLKEFLKAQNMMVCLVASAEKDNEWGLEKL